MAIIHANDNNFNEKIQNGTVLVDFYADWCGPCRMLSPILEGLSNDINIVKVNVDKAPTTAQQFGIMSIPTIIVFKDGKEITKKIGLCSKEDIKEMVK